MAESEKKTVLNEFEHDCPYLGLNRDISTHSDFPSSLNYCHRSRPSVRPSLIHQREFCLSENHKNCILIANPKAAVLPSKYQIAKTKKSLKPLIIGLLITILLIIAGTGILGLVNGKTPGQQISAFSNFFKTSIKPPSKPIPTQSVVSAEEEKTAIAALPTKTPQITSTPLSTFVTPSATLMATDSPSVIGTPDCEYSITYYGISYYGGNTIQISFNTTVNLSRYLILDKEGQATERLALPDVRLLRNGLEVFTFGTYLRNSKVPSRLFLEIKAVGNDTIELEFTDNSRRYCTGRYTIPVPPTKTPANGSTAPTNKPPTQIPPSNTPVTPAPPTNTPVTPLPPTNTPVTPLPPTKTPIPPTIPPQPTDTPWKPTGTQLIPTAKP